MRNVCASFLMFDTSAASGVHPCLGVEWTSLLVQIVTYPLYSYVRSFMTSVETFNWVFLIGFLFWQFLIISCSLIGGIRGLNEPGWFCGFASNLLVSQSPPFFSSTAQLTAYHCIQAAQPRRWQKNFRYNFFSICDEKKQGLALPKTGSRAVLNASHLTAARGGRCLLFLNDAMF